jgi:putative phosphoribosyl transferase
MNALYTDRRDAGTRLAVALEPFSAAGVVVLALPRGGVPVAYEVARALDAPLDVFVVRKLGLPGHEELAMGAIASGGVRVLDAHVLEMSHVPREAVEAVVAREVREIERREETYRRGRPAPPVRGRTVVLVDDGLATGSTMRAAVAAIRGLDAARVVVAVPVGSRVACDALREEADALVCLATPDPFRAVGLWYEDFDQTSDEEVCRLLDEAAAARVTDEGRSAWSWGRRPRGVHG